MENSEELVAPYVANCALCSGYLAKKNNVKACCSLTTGTKILHAKIIRKNISY